MLHRKISFTYSLSTKHVTFNFVASFFSPSLYRLNKITRVVAFSLFSQSPPLSVFSHRRKKNPTNNSKTETSPPRKQKSNRSHWNKLSEKFHNINPAQHILISPKNLWIFRTLFLNSLLSSVTSNSPFSAISKQNYTSFPIKSNFQTTVLRSETTLEATKPKL